MKRRNTSAVVDTTIFHFKDNFKQIKAVHLGYTLQLFHSMSIRCAKSRKSAFYKNNIPWCDRGRRGITRLQNIFLHFLENLFISFVIHASVFFLSTSLLIIWVYRYNFKFMTSYGYEKRIFIEG